MDVRFNDFSSTGRRATQHAVVILNDDRHSRAHVIDMLRRVFGYSRQRAARLMLKAHFTGKAIVWIGAFEVAEFKCERIREFGNDPQAREYTTPLSCEIEPLR